MADNGLCALCQSIKEVAWTDTLDREYCQDCLDEMEIPTGSPALEFMALTVPFKVGDRVECRTAGVLYVGIGVIDEVSTKLEKFGTPYYPSFHVQIEDKAYPEAPDAIWFMEQQLTKVSA